MGSYGKGHYYPVLNLIVGGAVFWCCTLELQFGIDSIRYCNVQCWNTDVPDATRQDFLYLAVVIVWVCGT